MAEHQHMLLFQIVHQVSLLNSESCKLYVGYILNQCLKLRLIGSHHGPDFIRVDEIVCLFSDAQAGFIHPQ